MEQFTKPSQLRIVIAFSMGIDCPDVQLVHYSSLVIGQFRVIYTGQETGRAGRDGQTAYAKLLITKQWKRYADDSMKMYIENDSKCRREVLFCDMEGYHAIPFERLCLCCDVCVYVTCALKSNDHFIKLLKSESVMIKLKGSCLHAPRTIHLCNDSLRSHFSKDTGFGSPRRFSFE